MTRLVDACWSLFKAGVALALVGAIALGVYMYARMDEEIRAQVEAVLTERFPQYNVAVGGARLIEGKGIALYDLVLADPRGATGSDRLLVVDELMLVCRASLAELVHGVPEVRRVEVKRPQIWLRRSTTGRWNYESLLPIAPCGLAVPQIVIRDGAATVVDESNPEAPLAVRDAVLTIEPTAQAAAVGQWPSLKIDGSFTSPLVKHVQLHGTLEGPQRRIAANAAIDSFHLDKGLSPWIRNQLPPTAAMTQATGTLDGVVGASWTCGGGVPPQVQADLRLSEGRVDDPRLPRTLTDVFGRIVATPTELKVEELHGKCGLGTVAISLNRRGWGARAPIALAARVSDMPLNNEIYRTLPVLLRQQWDRYLPAGLADGTLQATFDGERWIPSATLTGRQVSFESEKFPYRVTAANGSLRFTPASAVSPPLVNLDFTGVAGGQPVHIVGRVVDPRPGAAGWVEITGNDLEIEQAMIDALQPKPREVVNSLRPAGKFNVAIRVERTAAGVEPHSTMRLDLTDARINYEKFPYALRGIRGTIISEDNRWTFRDLVSGGRRTIYGEGHLLPTPEGTELALRFTGRQVPLDDELFDALPEGVQSAWNALKPRGLIDLTVDVYHRTGLEKPSIRATIEPRPETAQINPGFFPYLFERLSGAVTYEDGHVLLREVRGEHDRTVVRTNGEGDFLPDGRWNLRFVGLTADRVTPRTDLLAALPRQLTQTIERLHPTGGFGIHDAVLEFRRAASEYAPVEASWDLVLDCEQTDLNCGILLENVHGSVRLVGQFDGARSSSAGELDLETVAFKGVQFTSVKGPIWIDEAQCRLGRNVPAQTGAPARPITAIAYGGNIAADGMVAFGGVPKYGAKAAIRGADLHRLVVERFGGNRDFRGLVDADVELGGEGYNMQTLLGKGDVQITQANFYELPLLASVVKMLKTGSSDATAFTESDIRFRLQGPHIYLDKINFLGDVINLYGHGYTNLDEQLQLAFDAVVGRRDYALPMVNKIVKQVDGFAMQLYVGGTLGDPQVTTQALPGVKQVLQMGSDLVTPVGDAGRPQERSSFLGLPRRQ